MMSKLLLAITLMLAVTTSLAANTNTKYTFVTGTLINNTQTPWNGIDASKPSLSFFPVHGDGHAFSSADISRKVPAKGAFMAKVPIGKSFEVGVFNSTHESPGPYWVCTFLITASDTYHATMKILSSGAPNSGYRCQYTGSLINNTATITVTQKRKL